MKFVFALLLTSAVVDLPLDREAGSTCQRSSRAVLLSKIGGRLSGANGKRDVWRALDAVSASEEWRSFLIDSVKSISFENIDLDFLGSQDLPVELMTLATMVFDLLPNIESLMEPESFVDALKERDAAIRNPMTTGWFRSHLRQQMRTEVALFLLLGADGLQNQQIIQDEVVKGLQSMLRLFVDMPSTTTLPAVPPTTSGRTLDEISDEIFLRYEQVFQELAK